MFRIDRAVSLYGGASHDVVEPSRPDPLDGTRPTPSTGRAAPEPSFPAPPAPARTDGPGLSARLRAALWGCSVGIMIGLALSELWPA